MILVTGGCGYLGSHCTIDLLNNNKEVIILDNLSNSDQSINNKITTITNKKFKFEKVDIRNKKELSKLFSSNNIESVIHFAGLKSISDSYTQQSDYYSVNVLGTICLLETILEYDVKNIVFSSSATVYGDNNPSPWKEDLVINFPESPYAQTKFVVERLLETYVIKKKLDSVAILRYFNPIGYHESGIIGENLISSKNLIPAIMSYFLEQNDYVSIFGNDYDTIDGTGRRDYIHVSDLIRGHVQALNYINENKGLYIWNLGSGKCFSVLEIINLFEEALKKKIKLRIEPKREGDLGEFWADIDKAKKDLSWSPKKTINQMIDDIIKFLLNQMN